MGGPWFGFWGGLWGFLSFEGVCRRMLGERRGVSTI